MVYLSNIEKTKENKEKIEDFYEHDVKVHKIERDNITLSAISYTKDNAIDNLVIIPGRAECEHKYADLIYDLKEKDINIYVLFVRGQGSSTRFYKDSPICHIENFDDYTSDINFMLEHFKIKDYKLLAFSLGGLISLSYYVNYDNKPSKIALMAPFIWPAFNLPKSILKLFVNVAVHLSFKASYTPHGREYKYTAFEDNHHSHDRYRYEKYHDYYKSHMDLALGGPSYNFVYLCLKEQERLFNLGFDFDRDTFVSIAIQDKVVSAQMACQFFAKHEKDSHPPLVKEIVGCYHDILNEADEYREQSLELALRFLFDGDK